jgi:hypothetical protein
MSDLFYDRLARTMIGRARALDTSILKVCVCLENPVPHLDDEDAVQRVAATVAQVKSLLLMGEMIPANYHVNVCREIQDADIRIVGVRNWDFLVDPLP